MRGATKAVTVRRRVQCFTVLLFHIRKTHLFGHFSHFSPYGARTSNIRSLRNTKHPYLRKIRTLAGGQTKGGFGAWVKSESETGEKHEFFLFFVIFFLLTTPGELVKLASCRATSMLPKKLRKNDCELMYTAPHYSHVIFDCLDGIFLHPCFH